MPKYSDAASCGRADNLLARLNNGYLRAYNGTAPATADTALSGNTLLQESRFNATAFPASSGHGSATSNAITAVAATVSSTPTFYRGYASDGTTCVVQWNTTDIVLSPTNMTNGVTVTYTAMVHTEPAGS